MSVAVFPSEATAGGGVHLLNGLRVRGSVSIAAIANASGTALSTLHETGGYRVKFPDRRGGTLEAVIINTGGGVAGGDRVTICARAETDARLSITSATAERIYRTHGPAADVGIRLEVAPGATLAWLPQATLLFSGCNLRRSVEAQVASNARLIVAEVSVFGRGACGQGMASGAIRDHWRIRRNGALVFAEAMRLEGDIARTLARPAVAAGATISALVVCVAPEAGARIEQVRACLADPGLTGRLTAGASAWNDLLVVRILGERLDHVCAALRACIGTLEICPLPTAWTH